MAERCAATTGSWGKRLVERIHEIVVPGGRQLPGRGECGDLLTPGPDCGSRAGGAPGSGPPVGLRRGACDPHLAAADRQRGLLLHRPGGTGVLSVGGVPGNPPAQPQRHLDERALDYGVKTMASLFFFWREDPPPDRTYTTPERRFEMRLDQKKKKSFQLPHVMAYPDWHLRWWLPSCPSSSPADSSVRDANGAVDHQFSLRK